MWARVEDRLALLELLTSGALRRRAAQDQAYAHLAALPWTRATGRRDELALVPERRAALVELLDRVWPAWRAEQLALVVAGEPPTPAGYGRLADQRRAAVVPELPPQVNRRTAAAMTGPDSKSTLTAGRRSALGEREVTHDGLVRLRVPPGLVARRGGVAVPLDPVVAVFDEVGVADRALRDGLVLEGEISAILTVENLGAWRDLPRPGRLVLAHVPGWNTATVAGLVRAAGAPRVVHFGDLDPNGVRIVEHLRSIVPGLGWLVVEGWEDLVDAHGLARDWPRELELGGAPELVRRLAAAGRWLEQERLVGDARLAAALAELG